MTDIPPPKKPLLMDWDEAGDKAWADPAEAPPVPDLDLPQGQAMLAASRIATVRGAFTKFEGTLELTDDLATSKAYGTVAVNPSTTLGVRHVPRQNAKQYRQLRTGTRVGIICQTTGSRVTGTFGTTRIWNKLVGSGYASDAYIRTGSDKSVAPRC